MNMTPVKSSQIESIGHYEETQVLCVRFKSGDTYEYDGVSPEVFNDFLTAESVGAYFGKNIRGQYEYTKLERDE